MLKRDKSKKASNFETFHIEIYSRWVYFTKMVFF